MSRIPPRAPHELDEPRIRLYKSIIGARRSGAVGALSLVDKDGHLAGPFNAMLLNPDLGMALQELGTAIRTRGELSPRCRELAILAVAAQWQSAFELHAHTLIGAQVGLTDAEMESLCAGRTIQLADAEEAAVLAAARTLVQTANLSESEYAAAVAALSPAKLFEISTLVGYYSLLALQMRVFDINDQS